MEHDYVFNEYDSSVTEDVSMTEKYANGKKFGLWGPDFSPTDPAYVNSQSCDFIKTLKNKAMYEDPGYNDGVSYEDQYNGDIPIGLDTQGRRNYKINKIKEKMDNDTLKSSGEISDEIVAAVLSAVRTTDTNLILLANRINSIKKYKATDGIIMQSEALSIFKGNLIRCLKQIFTPSDINRIKKGLNFAIGIDVDLPIISSLKTSWTEYREYNAPWALQLRGKLLSAFDKVSVGDIEQQGIIALRDCPFSPVEPTEPGQRIVKYLTDTRTEEQEITSPKQINFDSIKNIKF